VSESRRRRRRVLAAVAGGLAALGLLAAGLVWWAVSTRAGARWAFARITSAMKGSVRVTSVDGPIRGPLTVRGLVYETPALRISVEEARLDWRLSALIAKRLDVVSLSARGVRIRTSPEPEKKEKEKLPDLHLPINVVVRAADVRDIEVGSSVPDGGPPFRIDTISLATSVSGDAVRVERLAVRGPRFTADVSGTLRPSGDYPLDLAVAWSWTTDRKYEGSGRLNGTLETLHVAQELKAPARLTLDATLLKPMRHLRFSADVRFEKLDPRVLAASAPAALATGAVHAEGTLPRFSSKGEVRLETRVADLGKVDASWDVERQEDLWKIARLDLRLAEGSSARASGTVRLGGASPAFDLAASWTRMEWPLRGRAAVASSRGNLRLEGTLAAYRVTADADVSAKGLPPGTWKIAGRGDTAHVALDSLAGSILGGTFSASGSVAWKPAVAWDLAIAGENLDPSGMAPGYPGRLAFRGATKGTLEKSGPVGSVSLASLDGTLRGQPVSGAAEARFAVSDVILSKADFHVATARLQGSGRIGDAWDLSFRLDTPDVGLVLPDARGSLAAAGHVSGRRETPRLRVTADGRSLSQGARQVARLRLDADVDFRRDAPSRVDLDLGGVVLVAGRTVDTVALRLAGTLAHHDLTLTAKNAKTNLAFAAAGGVPHGSGAPSSWEGRVTRLDLTSTDLAGKLERPADVFVSAAAARIRGFAWALKAGRLTLEGEWAKAGPSRMHAGVENVPLALVSPWLPGGVEVTGAVNGRVEASVAKSGAVDATVDLSPGPGEIRYGTTGGARVAFAYSDAKLLLAAGPRGATANVALAIAGQGRFAADLAMPDYNARGVPQKSERLAGRVTASFADLAFARAFVPAIGQLHGAFRADVAFDGTVGNPRIRGEAGLSGVTAELPDLGITVQDVSLTARADGGPLFRLDGQARSGEGTVKIAGESPLVPSVETPAKLRIQGRMFQALGTPEQKVWVSPDLTIAADGRKIAVSGDLRVPQTRIEYVQKFATIAPSKDIVFVGKSTDDEAQAAGSRAQVVEARVRLVLGNLVRIKALGFDGRVTGSVLATDVPGRPTAATGELQITEGTYKAYGQDLKIERGRVVFGGGPAANPAVDLRASRKADDGTIAGVEVKGTVRNPEVSVWSDPAMDQTDALAYLVLGHPLGQATAQEGNLVANAAVSLGVKGGNLLGKKIASRYGLETARIEAKNGLESASLVVGKYLSPKLYVEYGIGLFDPVSTLRLRYIISRKWTVSAETSGDANGGDVLYTVDTGKVPGPPPPPRTAERRGD
jgi:translocation and assembly module TamB